MQSNSKRQKIIYLLPIRRSRMWQKIRHYRFIYEFSSVVQSIFHVRMKEALTVKFAATKKPCKLFYRLFSNTKRSIPPKSQQPWDKACVRVGNVKIDWEAASKGPSLYTASTRFREFQFKILHKMIATNSLLHKIKITDTNLCSFCLNFEETSIHLYW